IICDGWSLDVLLRDLMALYRSEELPALAIQYADYSTWQRERAEDETAQRGLDYWKQKLAGMPALEISTDFERPARRTFNGATESAVISRDLSEAIKKLSRNRDATTFITLLAALQTLLFRYSGQGDLAIGSPVAGGALVGSED